MPWEIYLACAKGESIDVRTYVDLHTVIDVDGLFDIIELDQVHASWLEAARDNAREEAEREARMRHGGHTR